MDSRCGRLASSSSSTRLSSAYGSFTRHFPRGAEISALGWSASDWYSRGGWPDTPGRGSRLPIMGSSLVGVLAAITATGLGRAGSFVLPLLFALDVLAPVILGPSAHDCYRSFPLLILAGTIVLAGTVGRGFFAERVLGSRLMVYLGEVSLGLYLLHRPVMYPRAEPRWTAPPLNRDVPNRHGDASGCLASRVPVDRAARTPPTQSDRDARAPNCANCSG